MKEVRFEQITSLEIKSQDNRILKTQKDGEFFVPKEPRIEIAIHPKSLNVCVQ